MIYDFNGQLLSKFQAEEEVIQTLVTADTIYFLTANAIYALKNGIGSISLNSSWPTRSGNNSANSRKQ